MNRPEYRIEYLDNLAHQNRELFDSPCVWRFEKSDLPLDPRKRFPACRRTFLEIGFGHGEVLEELVQRHPETGFIGIERRPFRVRKALRRLQRLGTQNALLLRANLELIQIPLFKSGAFDEILINHPDPWSKRRHEPHRFFRPRAMDWLADLLAKGGVVEVSSDQENYFFYILSLFQADSRFHSLLPAPDFTTTPIEGRPVSRFEQMMRSAGKAVRLLRFQRSTAKE